VSGELAGTVDGGPLTDMGFRDFTVYFNVSHWFKFWAAISRFGTSTTRRVFFCDGLLFWLSTDGPFDGTDAHVERRRRR